MPITGIVQHQYGLEAFGRIPEDENMTKQQSQRLQGRAWRPQITYRRLPYPHNIYLSGISAEPLSLQKVLRLPTLLMTIFAVFGFFPSLWAQSE